MSSAERTVKNRFLRALSGPAFGVVLAAISASTLFAQSQGTVERVAVVDLEADLANPTTLALAETMSRTLVFVMDLLGVYDITRVPFLTPQYDLAVASRYLRQEGFEYALYGTIGQDGGEYTIDLYAWQRGRDEPVITVSRRVDSVFEIFDVGDDSAIELIETFSGEELAFAALTLTNQGADGVYSVYVDGRYVGEGITSARILAGRRRVEIFRPGRLGEELVDETVVNLPPDGTATFEFSLDEPEDPPAGAAAGERPETLVYGDISISVRPGDATVYLDGQEVGTGTVEIRRLAAGPYAVALRHPAYLPLDDVIVVEPFARTVFERVLPIDRGSPIVRSHLTPTYLPPLMSGVVTLAQVFTLGPHWVAIPDDSFSAALFHPAVIAAGPRMGHVVAGDPLTAVGLSVISAVGVSAIMYDSVNMGVLGYTGLGLTVGSVLYDVFFSGFAAERANRRAIERLSDDSTAQIRAPVRTDGVYLTAHAGYGAAVGAELRVLDGHLGMALLGGFARGDRGFIESPIGQLRARVTGHPTAGMDLWVHPYFSGTFVAATDFDAFEPYGGIGVGFEVVLGRLVAFFEVPYMAPQTSRAHPYVGVSWRLSQ